MAIQLQANMVDKQLQIMFHSDLVPNLSTLRAKSESEMSIGMSEGVGRAREEPNERYSKVKRIILAAAPVEWKQVEECVTLYVKKLALDLWQFTISNDDEGDAELNIALTRIYIERWSVKPWQSLEKSWLQQCLAAATWLGSIFGLEFQCQW
jgi:hypothetical protein